MYVHILSAVFKKMIFHRTGYQMIAKPRNMTGATSWPDPYASYKNISFWSGVDYMRQSMRTARVPIDGYVMQLTVS